MLRGLVAGAREASQRAHSGRGPGRGGQAVAPLSCRTASFPTRRSACSIRPARGWRWGRTRRRRRSKTPRGRSTICAVQTRILERESALGADHSERSGGPCQTEGRSGKPAGELKGRWEKERDLVGKIREVRGKLEAASGAAEAQASADGAAVQTARGSATAAARRNWPH